MIKYTYLHSQRFKYLHFGTSRKRNDCTLLCIHQLYSSFMKTILSYWLINAFIDIDFKHLLNTYEFLKDFNPLILHGTDNVQYCRHIK